MSVANLTRFGYVRVTTGISDDWDIAARSDGEYVKFEEAVEASSNSLQQLKAEILRYADELDSLYIKDCDLANAKDLVERMRQLSAV